MNGYELGELHDVLINGVSNGDLISWNSSSRVWKNTKTLSGSYTLSGSLTTNNSISTVSLTSSFISASSITGSLFGTASWANDAVTASYITLAQTASYVLNAVSSSFASTASFVQTAQTASYVLNAVSSSFSTTSSYALTASYALNGGGGAITIADEGIAQGTATFLNFTGTGVAATVLSNTASITINGGGGGGTVYGYNATASFISQSTWTFNHNLGTKTVIVQALDTNFSQLIPSSITLTSDNIATITFPSNVSGYAIASLGGANAFSSSCEGVSQVPSSNLI